MADTINTFKSESINQKRWKRFKRIKRGYYSLIIIATLYFLSFFLPLLVNNKALVVKHEGSYYFPAFAQMISWVKTPTHFEGSHFGQTEVFGEKHHGEANYRELKKQFKKESKGNWVLMPFYDYNPVENILGELEGKPPTAPDRKHWLGTDNRGRDVFARLAYGFQVSISFALVVTFFSYLIGILIGGILGFYGGKVDLYGVRFIEIFSGIPFLFTIMIIASFMKPNFSMLAILLIILGGWMGSTFYIRAEFFREKARDYVAAAKAMGASDWRIMLKHILPNSLVPIITFAPFAIVGYIFSLVSLDFLGFGLRPPTPSWGELINQGREDIVSWWLIISPFIAMFLTLLAITFIGEGVREAFDPKKYSRLR